MEQHLDSILIDKIKTQITTCTIDLKKLISEKKYLSKLNTLYDNDPSLMKEFHLTKYHELEKYQLLSEKDILSNLEKLSNLVNNNTFNDICHQEKELTDLTKTLSTYEKKRNL